MPATPLVSIVIPAFNDAEVIASALDSCLRQTLESIEIIVVDDASVDETAEIVEQYSVRDSRVRLIRQERNASAYQARRRGILAARADHVLFLDGDDELSERAAEAAWSKASATGADLVQFGIEVVHVDGRTGGPFESRLQPKHAMLMGSDVLRKLFPVDRPAQGQLWRYLFRTQLLVDAYELMPTDLVLPRVNDLPIAFLVAALAARFESIPDRLYRYHFGRGGSGQKVHDIETARFYAGAIRSIDSIDPAVKTIAERSSEREFVLATYASVRRAIIGYTTHYLATNTRADLLDAAFAELYSLATPRDVVQSTALHWPQSIDALAAHAAPIALPARPARSVLLATNHLRTGGISGVIISQARILQEAGFRVTIAAREPGSDLTSIPRGVDFVEIPSGDLGTALSAWAEAGSRNDIDLVIDHQWQYSANWQAFALAARADGIATIGWSHSFAGRSLLLGIERLEAAPRYFPLLAHLVVLSPLDVAFWKLRGLQRVSYLPNPPSQLFLDAGIVDAPKPAPTGRRIELIWWGRLQERTKRVTELLSVAEHLKRMGVDFRLRIVGPDWRDMTAARLNAIAKERGLAEQVRAVGPLRGAALTAAIDSADLFINTSIIEGYPLTIPEAQARGLPVVMYELPWLAVAIENDGLIGSSWGDPTRLADRIAQIRDDRSLYSEMSAAALSAANNEAARDLRAAYCDVFNATAAVRPDTNPSLADARQLIELTIKFAEQRAAAKAVTARSMPPKGVVVPLPTKRLSSLRVRAVNVVDPIAKSVLEAAPWLRPAARRVRDWFLRR